MTGKRPWSAGDPAAAIPVIRPAVARPPRSVPVAAAAGAMTLLGAGVFLWLADGRAARADQGTGLPPLAGTAITTPAPLAFQGPPPPAVPQQAPFVPTVPSVSAANPIVGPPAATYTAPNPDRARERLRSPTLIVDLAQAEPPRGAAAAAAALEAAPPPQADPGRNLSDTERFAARVGGAEVEVAEAERLTGLSRLVPQGAIIGAVMETALNSDLPGFARAIVQRDVLSFDGTAVLIPSGSRVIGQYKSGVAQGASRVFILWTRLIRPDGVSIALGSPVIDELGRGGIPGKVNRHFLQRFGGAILLSVLTGGINAAAASVGSGGGATVVVGSANEASTLVQQAARDLDIPPTITTAPGASVRIFVARDLDFTRVGPAR